MIKKQARKSSRRGLQNSDITFSDKSVKKRPLALGLNIARKRRNHSPELAVKAALQTAKGDRIIVQKHNLHAIK